MAHSVDTIIKLLTATHCLLILDGALYSVGRLIKMAEVAKNVGSQVTIVHANRIHVEGLILIATADKGVVTIDMS